MSRHRPGEDRGRVVLNDARYKLGVLRAYFYGDVGGIAVLQTPEPRTPKKPR